MREKVLGQKSLGVRTKVYKVFTFETLLVTTKQLRERKKMKKCGSSLKYVKKRNKFESEVIGTGCKR